MTIRLGHVLPEVISLSQSGFVLGRLLSDNVLLAQELVHSIESRRPDANVVFKLDMAKAYDRVSWEFLYQVLRRKGFPQRWIGLVANAVSHYWFSVLVNGLDRLFAAHPTMYYQALGQIRGWAMLNLSLEGGWPSKCVAGHSVASASGDSPAQACFPVAEGGLGVCSLADYVWAFSMKLWWRFRGRSSLWSEYLHGRYCRNLHPTIVSYIRNHYPIWHRLCRIRDVAERVN
ncbi:hypothetical protein Sango_2806400 [Sesamum angolense]|uniref:Reverse transcriptase domain-containing protein n=1 Tax=Sesamum angolense TaxID=2727404 RepID=A0AAE1T7X1_9LAMI|nr:hypothetical protein Sango_2806400 [Sesamum angolense]